jgi:hypothetical protein
MLIAISIDMLFVKIRLFVESRRNAQIVCQGSPINSGPEKAFFSHARAAELWADVSSYA